MKVLLIASYFPPDTAVAAVRPYMFAKYLTLKGHEVTILRSGEILAKVDSTYDIEKYGVNVISYLGENSVAERIKRGANGATQVETPQSRIAFVPVKLREPLARLYHKLMRPIEYLKEMKVTNGYFEKQKIAIDKLRGEQFDVVWATFGRLENVFAGAYAGKVFSCPWILDCRDRIANEWDRIVRTMQKKTEKEFTQLADACVVVNRTYCDELKKAGANAWLIYNGYDDAQEPDIAEDVQADGKLKFCYTGSMYTGKLDMSPLFKALAYLKKENRIDLSKVSFTYAGAEYEYIWRQAQSYAVQEIMVNAGYLNRKAIRDLQRTSDIFAVAARDSKYCYGELPGKFYEGIRAQRPILTITTSDRRHGDLWQMQEKYRYGFCYETTSEKETFNDLCDYVEKAYIKVLQSGELEYQPSEALSIDFHYDHLTDQLEKIMLGLVERNEL